MHMLGDLGLKAQEGGALQAGERPRPAWGRAGGVPGSQSTLEEAIPTL
jgi:hypothetical protein